MLSFYGQKTITKKQLLVHQERNSTHYISTPKLQSVVRPEILINIACNINIKGNVPKLVN